VAAPEGPPFELVVLRSGQTAVIRVAGELDCATAPRLAGALAEVTRERPTRIVVDAAQLEFVDPAGARPLLETAHALPADGALRVRGAPPRVRRVFALLGLTPLLDD
jgi:anti-sigma B factor antagonist